MCGPGMSLPMPGILCDAQSPSQSTVVLGWATSEGLRNVIKMEDPFHLSKWLYVNILLKVLKVLSSSQATVRLQLY